MSATANHRMLRFAAALAPVFLAGCGRAPAVEILGSFFPAWLVCFASAVTLAALCRFLLLRFHLKFDLPILAYLSLTAFLTFALWLIFYH